MISHEFKWHRREKIDNTIALYRNDDRMIGNLEELHLLRGGVTNKIVCGGGIMSVHPTIPFY